MLKICEDEPIPLSHEDSNESSEDNRSISEESDLESSAEVGFHMGLQEVG
jgi:hypothetical protein